METGRADPLLRGERCEAVDRGVARLEAEDEDAVGLGPEEPLLQPTLSQAATFGWSLSTAPTWAAPPGEV